ncbi:unnamed protein product [Brassica oleracea]
MMAYDGGKGRIFFKEAISRHTSVINFVQKEFAEMFPRWDFDVEDSAAENIIKVMFNAKANWNWTMNCWKVTGTKPRVKKEASAAETESGVKEESAVPQKKARKAASVEASKVPSVEASKVPSAEAHAEARSVASTCVGGMTKEQMEKIFKGIADVMRNGFEMCLGEIKLLGDRLEAVEKKSESVNGAKAGQNGAKAGHNYPQEPSSSKDLSVVLANEPPEQSGEPSVLVLDKEVPTDSDLQKGETRR